MTLFFFNTRQGCPQKKKVEWCFMPTFIIINLHKYFYHKVGGSQSNFFFIIMNFTMKMIV